MHFLLHFSPCFPFGRGEIITAAALAVRVCAFRGGCALLTYAILG